ncbi:hypothetical protein Sjap_021019 [Stephania japonica]|uniref:Uncharacterized protein n=1 Tax=Stephania japonica TaxID=461633 RepID=A0AAP0F1U0_9MAGN
MANNNAALFRGLCSFMKGCSTASAVLCAIYRKNSSSEFAPLLVIRAAICFGFSCYSAIRLIEVAKELGMVRGFIYFTFKLEIYLMSVCSFLVFMTLIKEASY